MGLTLRNGKVQTTISIDKDLHSKAMKEVQERDRSFNWIVNKALEKYLKEGE